MNDDIVTRLRRAHISCMEWIKTQGQEPTSTIHEEAANEIERLRKVISQLPCLCRCGQCEPCIRCQNTGARNDIK